MQPSQARLAGGSYEGRGATNIFEGNTTVTYTLSTNAQLTSAQRVAAGTTWLQDDARGGAAQHIDTVPLKTSGNQYEDQPYYLAPPTPAPLIPEEIQNI